MGVNSRSSFTRSVGDDGVFVAEASANFFARDPFEHFEKLIEFDLIAAVLDQGAGVGDRCPIAFEDAADLGHAQSANDMGQVHCCLARQGNMSATSRGTSQRIRWDIKNPGY